MVVTVGELLEVPDVDLALLAVIDLDLYLPLLSLLLVEGLALVLSVDVLELCLERYVALEFLGDEVDFEHLGEVLG